MFMADAMDLEHSKALKKRWTECCSLSPARIAMNSVSFLEMSNELEEIFLEVRETVAGRRGSPSPQRQLSVCPSRRALGTGSAAAAPLG